MTNLKRLLLGGLGATVSCVAFAATDGSAGTSSTATSNITVVKAPVMQITGLNDITLAKSGSDYVATEQLCVYSSGVSYNVTMSSTGSSGFQLASGVNTLDYGVTWTDEGGTPATVTEGVALAGQSSSADATCSASGGTNTSFEATVTGAAFAAAAFGDYTDTLTILIAPD